MCVFDTVPELVLCQESTTGLGLEIDYGAFPKSIGGPGGFVILAVFNASAELAEVLPALAPASPSAPLAFAYEA